MDHRCTASLPLTLACLQAGRALAALLVVMYHNGLYIFALDKYWGHDPAGSFFTFAHAGVEFFFVLSGFIILYIHWPDIGRPERFLSFAKKRFLRIFPMYWLVLAVIVPVYFLVPSFGQPYHRDPVILLSSVLLVHVDPQMRSALAVAWTLYHEILFYAVFALAILNRTWGLTVLALWLLVSAASLFTSPSFPLEYLASPLHLLFGMGMLACLLLKSTRLPYPAALAWMGMALFFATGMEESYGVVFSNTTRNVLYGLGSAFALAGLVELERQGRLRVPGWLALMGDASYAIYLTHFTLLSLLAKLFIRFGAKDLLPDALCYILLPLLAVLMGVAIHRFVERPLLRWLRRGTITAAVAAPQFA